MLAEREHPTERRTPILHDQRGNCNGILPENGVLQEFLDGAWSSDEILGVLRLRWFLREAKEPTALRMTGVHETQGLSTARSLPRAEGNAPVEMTVSGGYSKAQSHTGN